MKTKYKDISQSKLRKINARKVADIIPARITSKDMASGSVKYIAILTSKPVGGIIGTVRYNEINRGLKSDIENIVDVDGCLEVVKIGNQNSKNPTKLGVYISRP